jgi:hypothetical protein
MLATFDRRADRRRMVFRMTGRQVCCFLAVALGMLVVISARAGDDGGSALDFVRSFLERYPRFRAEGIMTSTLVGKTPYRCKVEMLFDKTDSVLFSYNTDESKNIIPYDFAYADHRLRETIYNRDRSQILKSTELGAPMRTVFNFVWDLLHEAEHGAGFNSFLFNGLMSIERNDLAKGTIITLHRRIPAGPVEVVVFTFDSDQRLRRIEITQGDGAQHRIDIRKFRIEPPEVKAPPPRH